MPGRQTVFNMCSRCVCVCVSFHTLTICVNVHISMCVIIKNNLLRPSEARTLSSDAARVYVICLLSAIKERRVCVEDDVGGLSVWSVVHMVWSTSQKRPRRRRHPRACARRCKLTPPQSVRGARVWFNYFLFFFFVVFV